MSTDGGHEARSAGAVDGLAVEGAVLRYGSVTAVDAVDLAVAPGEVVALVGPSGCGKSSLLRLVTGLESAAAGDVRWAGSSVADLPPHRRGFGLMFQDHALFPHRTIGENVEFGLRMQGVDAAGRRQRVDEVLALVDLAGYGPRAVDTLSGGEAQRVALARALAPAPRVLLLDEPLGSLDRVLRERLAADLRTVLKEAGVAAVLVTHDQEEAYAVADRLAVMRAGRIVRDGPAAGVWWSPGRAWTARFLGHENVLDGVQAASLGLGEGPALVHDAGLVADPEGPVAVVVESVAFRGPTARVRGRVVDVDPPLVLAVPAATPPSVGDRLRFRIDPAHVVALTP